MIYDSLSMKYALNYFSIAFHIYETNQKVLVNLIRIYY